MRLSRDDRRLSFWLIVSAATAAAMTAVNAVTTRFTGICYFPRLFLPFLFAAFNAVITGAWVRDRRPRLSFFLRSGGLYGLAIIVSALLATGMQFTPFPTIDASLARWDARLGWDAVAILRWIAARPLPRTALNLCYDSTDLQLFLIPLLTLLMDDRRRARVFLHAVVYSFLFGCLFYYFFPSSGPASVYSSPDFLPVQRDTALKFWQVHHSHPVTTWMGGMVAFPSFHVAWSALLVYVSATERRFLIASAILNGLVILSTVLLGWHFLVDVPAGILLAAAALFAGERASRSLSE